LLLKETKSCKLSQILLKVDTWDDNALHTLFWLMQISEMALTTFTNDK